MMYKLKVQVPSKVKEEEHYVAPCLKCDCDVIKIEEYDDKYGYISTATCTGCKNEVRVNCDAVCAIKEWNNRNDIPVMLLSKAALIVTLKEEIKDLKIKQRLRLKKSKTKKSATPKVNS